MDTFLNRICKIAENEGLTITSFERKIGASKGVLSRAISKNKDIQAKWLIKIVENYHLYNPHWLLTGDGEMLKGKDEERGISKDKYIKILERNDELKDKVIALQDDLLSCREKIKSRSGGVVEPTGDKV